MFQCRRPLLPQILFSALLATCMAAASHGEDFSEEQHRQLKEMRRAGYNLLYAEKFDDARAAFERMIDAFPARWEGYYDMACYHLRQEQGEPAIGWLHKAVDNGCDDYEFFRTDSDLRLVRESLPQDYRALLEKVQSRAKERTAREVRERASKLATKLPKGPLFEFDFKLRQLLTDGELSLTDLKGKVIIVDIWGTWCPPCRMEVPHFVELYNKYHDAGLEVVGINFEKDRSGAYLDYEGSRAKVPGEARRLGINYALLFGIQEIIRQVPGFRGFPTTLFIDHEGAVRVREVGYKPLEELEPIVLALLGDKIAADEAAREPAEEKDTESEEAE